jgi:BCD family chlorophyll transporter-like MFS transporter
MAGARTFGWLDVARLGCVQAALGAVVVLTTSTLNRVMVVELALPALLPGLLVAFHYAVQVVRPRMGHGADVTGRSTPWIVGGVAVLALGGVGAAVATAWMASDRAAGIALAVAAVAALGVWLMMIAGFVVTAGLAGKALDPYSPERLLAVSATVSAIAVAVAALAMWRLEGRAGAAAGAAPEADGRPRDRRAFVAAVRAVWAEGEARRFTVFVFVSMLAYSAQDLILEPFAGAVFGFTPGQSTQLSGVQHGGVLAGMLLAAFAGTRWKGRALGSLRGWTVGGCVASAVALGGLVLAGSRAAAGGAEAVAGWPLAANVFALGFANGVFSIAAIGSMMRLAGAGRERSEGVRMGVWGAAQALAFGLGGVVGTGASDVAHRVAASPAGAYASVFAFEALLFVGAAVLAARLVPVRSAAPALPPAVAPRDAASPPPLAA